MLFCKMTSVYYRIIINSRAYTIGDIYVVSFTVQCSYTFLYNYVRENCIQAHADEGMKGKEVWLYEGTGERGGEDDRMGKDKRGKVWRSLE